MGFLPNNILGVDAVLTKKGKELLARGDGSFNPAKFALSDDEINYELYDETHKSGSAFYGATIQSTPLLEASIDESQLMKSVLVTLPYGTSQMPVIKLGMETINIAQGGTITLQPQTYNYSGQASLVERNGYIATISDVRVLSSITGTGFNSEEVVGVNERQTIGSNVSKSVIGKTINITGTTLSTAFVGDVTTLIADITIVGRDSGAQITIPIQVTKS